MGGGRDRNTVGGERVRRVGDGRETESGKWEL